MFNKDNLLLIWLLVAFVHQTVSHTLFEYNGYARLSPKGTCVGNEERPENQIACKGQPFGELVPYPGDCAKFLVCNCEYPTVKDCAAGTWYDNQLKICNFPQNVDCDNSGNNTTTITTLNPTTTTEPSSTSTITTTVSGTCVGNEECPENQIACKGQPFGESVPYPGDCAKFLVCNCEYPTVKDCAPGTWFDNKLKICNFPQNVDCDNSGNNNTTITTLIPTTTSSTTVSDSGWEKNCSAPAGVSSDICSNYYDRVLLRYPYNCIAYINCTQGCPIMTYCPNDKVFNNLLKICDTPEVSQCETLPMPGITTETEFETNKPIICDPPLGISADYCAHHVPGTVLPYPFNCSSYILCNWLCPFLRQCGPNQVFNLKTYSCECADNVECVEIPYPTINPPTVTTDNSITPMVCDPPAGISADHCALQVPGTLLPYPYNCSSYILCNWLCPFLRQCGPNEVFNVKTGSCECSDNVECVEIPYPTLSPPTVTTDHPITPIVCDPPLGISADYCSLQVPGTVFPYPYNCSAYILCNWLCPHLKFCGPGKLFNVQLGICDSEVNVQCIENPYPTQGTTESTTSSTGDVTTQSPILPPDVNPELCKGEAKDTIFPYEANCQKYLMCYEGKVELHSCPEGWLFNADLKICDEAAEEVCYKGTTTATTEETTTEQSISTNGPVDQLCNGQMKGTSFPYTESCQMYYYCKGDGTYALLHCPLNNYYEPYSGDCGPDVSPTACKLPLTTTSVSTAPTTLSPDKMCEGVSAGNTFPYEINCRQYIRCMGGGNFKIINCPANNFYYPHSGDCGPSADEEICRKSTETGTTPTSTPTEISSEPPSTGICGSFSNGELIDYPNNCQKYINCVPPIPVGFYCPNNWYFEIKQQTCIPDTNGTCHEQPATTTVAPPTSDVCSKAENGKWELYPENCQMFYQCLGNGFYMLRICPDGEYVDPINEKCSRDVDSHYCQQDFDTTTAIIPTTIPTTPNKLCWQQPIGSKVSYPGLCDKFIVCELPIPVGYNCQEGLKFSLKSQKCVEPKDSDCGYDGTTNNTRCYDKPDYALLPYERDCSLFVICIKHIDYVAHCNHGQYFDSLREECSSEADKDSCLAGESSTTAIVTQTTSTIFEPTSSTTIDPNLGSCYGKPEGTHIPYPNNCGKFIVCHSAIPIAYDCPDNHEFSQKLGECVAKEMANCSVTTTTDVPTTTATATTGTESVITCEGLPNGSTLTYANDCSKYYICLNGQPRLTQCMANSYYNPTSGQCDSSSSLSCLQETTTTSTTTLEPTTTTTTTANPCYMEEDGYSFANIKNCSQFFMCLKDSVFLINCPIHSFFNPTMEECNSGTSSEECTESISFTTTTDGIITHTRPTTPPTTPVVPHRYNICCGKEPGTVLIHPSDKTKYVVCQYPLPEVFQCPPSTTFDLEGVKCV